jgi:hypothetical protein
MKLLAAGLALLFSGSVIVHAWDYEGHRMVNQVALASLPPDFPAWAKTPANAERIAFLAGEPDRWRNSRQALLQQYNGVDHYIDLEQLADAGIATDTLTPFRYDFVEQFAAGRAAHPDKFPAPDPKINQDHSREWPGFLPWAISEYYAKLRSAFSYLKALEANGRPDEVENARANLIYMMGVMGHYVGDGAQPLHATIHHHGWVGDNPAHYSTSTKIHGLIDGGFIAYAKIRPAELMPLVRPAAKLPTTEREDGRDPVFVAIVDYLLESERRVEPLYRLEQKGGFALQGPPSEEGRKFIDAQLVRGGEMLGALWVTAWRQSGPDLFLKASLLKRKSAEDAPAGGK